MVNISDRPAEVAGEVPGSLPPGRSTLLREVPVTGAALVVVEVPDVVEARPLPDRGWLDYYGDSSDIRLLRGPQLDLGVREVDLGSLEAAPWGSPGRYQVRVNAWFAPSATSCGVHHEHEFLELHTQVWGSGVMQKFHHPSEPEPYEEHHLAPGVTGAAPFCATDRAAWRYPWHQYHAHTDSIWLAVEFHSA